LVYRITLKLQPQELSTKRILSCGLFLLCQEHIRRVQKTNLWGQTSYDSEDYERELQKYIAKPSEYDNTVVEFILKSLRPKEAKWLGASILVRPLSDIVKLSYSIKSCSSDGELAGEISIKVSSEKQDTLG